ncbi:uncharacterized protein LOC111709823 [Eurytemora carolleeae]|uniref:uncharacterized protein LOC111709823 n=1 Tax=Eurytemora carolleeae TaxID=1294199 RepID=UPI000C794602|nr:uncharacterized protein LOC111709823 [Eurytemora carolleeae]|eukprot:XP_023339510.1 uncharacterized protein LOC111709823 [Eurytemora affinis]
MNLIFLQLGIILLGSQTAFGRGLRREKRNIYIPFSTKFPDQIIPDESVCLPRISCSKARISEYTDSSLPWTEFLTENGGSGTGYIDDTPLSGPVDLPEGVDLPDFTQFADDIQDLDIQPVVAEVDNYLIEQAEGTCTKDRQDYCDLNNEKDFLSPEHTMCKFCVSIKVMSIIT